MLERISDIYTSLRGCGPKRLAVPTTADTSVLQAVVDAMQEGLVTPILFGDESALCACLRELGEDPAAFSIVHCPDIREAAACAVKCVSSGEADILMKGNLQSADFLRAVFDREFGLRIPGATLFSVAVLEMTLEGVTKLLFLTDAGFIPLPDLKTKEEMIRQVVGVLRILGYENPKIAVLSAMEQVNPKMPSSTEARALQELNAQGILSGCTVCGPLSFDLSVSPRAAEHKGFADPVAGNADVLLVPSLETGNALLKSISLLISPPQSGFVCGTTRPVVFTSRADSPETKRNTIAMALLLAERGAYDR